MIASTPLGAFQRDFAAALLGGVPDGSGAALARCIGQPGFAVYRNTVATACIDALAANHPTVLQVVGTDWFRDAAAVFMRRHPPADGCLANYGAGFATFLADFEPARDMPYLPGVARLDRCWTEAHIAADAAALAAAGLAGLEPAQLAAAVLVPHPAARWARFDGVPVYSIWRRHREGADVGADIDWCGECALLTRPDQAVQWCALAPDALAFLDACAGGATFADAASEGGVDLARELPRLVAAGAFCRVDR